MSEPRLVYFDLEILPNLREALRVWPQLCNFPGRTLKATITSVICFGYSVGKETPKVISAWDFPEWVSDVNNDRRVCEAAYEILKDADGVITHNGRRFDWKYLQTRLLLNKLPTLPKIPHEDTKSLSSSNLYFFSNSLDYITQLLGLSRKLDHEGWELWEKVWERNPEAMDLMSKYCAQDVVALQDTYAKLRPFSTATPNHNLFSPLRVNLCPICGSTRLIRWGYNATKTNRFPRYRCTDCGKTCSTNSKNEMPR